MFATLAEPGRQPARDAAASCPTALDATQSALAKVDRLATVLGPTLEDLRPGGARARPGAAADAPVPDRDDADHPRPAAPVRARGAARPCSELRPAMRDLSAATPDLTRTFRVVNALLNTLAYNPPGAARRATCSGCRGRTTPAPRCSRRRTRTARSATAWSCSRCSTAQLLSSVAATNPALGTLVELLNGPTTERDLPGLVAGHRSGRRMNKAAPSFGRIAAMVVFALSCFGLLLFLWLAFGGAGPAASRRATASRRRSPRRPSSRPRPTCGSPACRSAR